MAEDARTTDGHSLGADGFRASLEGLAARSPRPVGRPPLERTASGLKEYRVSPSGQMTLPASARDEWGLRQGGRVSVAHLGELLVIIPAGADRARRFYDSVVDADDVLDALGSDDD